MEKEEALRLANAKIEHEHSRWNTWVIFFFGSIISTFTLWGQFKEIIPSYAPFIACALLSILWVFVALGIRRVTQSWVKVITHIENSSTDDKIKLNECYKNFEEKHNCWEDLFKFSLFRVTKVLTYLGIVLVILFLFLAVFVSKNSGKKSTQAIEINNLSKKISIIEAHTQQVESISQRIIRMESKINDIENKVEEYIKANSDVAERRAPD